MSPNKRNVLVGIVVLVIGFGAFYVTADHWSPFIPENTGTWGTFGWSGAYGTHFWIDPKEKVIGILMAQTPNREIRDDFETPARPAVCSLVLLAVDLGAADDSAEPGQQQERAHRHRQAAERQRRIGLAVLHGVFDLAHEQPVTE